MIFLKFEGVADSIYRTFVKEKRWKLILEGIKNTMIISVFSVLIGTALGYTKQQAFFRIVMPQAAMHFLPVYKGEFISLVKMTSIVGYIAVEDLTKMSDLSKALIGSVSVEILHIPSDEEPYTDCIKVKLK